MADRIYTRSGDAGLTGLYSGERVPKDDARIAACGDVDELNAVLGLARAVAMAQELSDQIAVVQRQLFVVGADIATTEDVPRPACRVPSEWTAQLEGLIDRAWGGLPALTCFIVPGGTQAAAHLHLARTVCRRAERSCAALVREGTLSPPVASYLNRLSDLLFAWARVANTEAGLTDTTVSPSALLP